MSVATPKLVLFAAATVTLLAGCQRTQEPEPPEIRPVRVVKIEQRVLGDTVTLTGTVQAQSEINFAFRIDGRIVERPLQAGDAVRPGQLLARLDPQNEQSTRCSRTRRRKRLPHDHR